MLTARKAIVLPAEYLQNQNIIIIDLGEDAPGEYFG
jgi:hypothetical protein